MGLFSSDDEQDTSTPQERATWKKRAQEQMDEQRTRQQAGDSEPQPRNHRRARRPE